jgi:hypothetical protein
MEQFLEMSYWSRGWILQEACLGRQIILCGADSIRLPVILAVAAWGRMVQGIDQPSLVDVLVWSAIQIFPLTSVHLMRIAR